MQQAWPIICQTPLAQAFFVDLIKMMFPNSAARYQMILEQAAQQQAQQQQSIQAQQTAKLTQVAMQGAQGVDFLHRHPEYFSDVGKEQAYPVIKEAAHQIKQEQERTKQNGH